MTPVDPEYYIAFSYNYASDRPFVGWLSHMLSNRGICTWFLDNFDSDAVQRSLGESGRDTRYSEDWRLKKQNWQATYLRQIQYAKGIIVVWSTEASASSSTPGRGMWREADAVEYIRRQNPVRVKNVQNPTPGYIPANESMVDLTGLVVWAQEVLAMPPVDHPRVTYEQRAAFNKILDTTGAVQYPEIKTRPTDWYELVRLDLYDVMWFCRRCGIESDNFIMGTEEPPALCPVCGFQSYEPDYNPAGLRKVTRSPITDISAASDLVEKVAQSIKLSEQAFALQEERRHDEAMEVNSQLARLCRQLGILELLADSLYKQALFLHQHEVLDKAAELYSLAEQVYLEMGEKVHLQHCLGNHGNILADYGEVVKAMAMYREQERICRELNNRYHLEMSLGNQAQIYVVLGKLDTAMMLLQEQERICRDIGKEDGLKFSLALQKRIMEKNGEDYS